MNEYKKKLTDKAESIKTETYWFQSTLIDIQKFHQCYTKTTENMIKNRLRKIRDLLREIEILTER